MKFNKTIIFLLVFTIAFTPFKTNAMAASTDINRKNLPVPTDYDSNLLQMQDMLMIFLLPYIREDVGKYYKPILKVSPEIEPWRIDLLDIKRLNGFRGFIFELTLEVQPTIGQHVLIGRERIQYRIDTSSVKLVEYTHIKSHQLPQDIKEFLR